MSISQQAACKQPARPAPARVLIVTPALASANNGNWQTAQRWADMLATDYDVTIASHWGPEVHQRSARPNLMIALHARRSAPSIAAFARTRRPQIVVLTGTDLYRDIRHDLSAQHSLKVADRLVVLQTTGIAELPIALHARTIVIEQSAHRLAPLPPRASVFDLALIGHLRSEKDPMTAVRALARLANPHLRLRHAGRTDDSETGPGFLAAAVHDRRIECMGALEHDTTRDLIRQSRLLLLPSIIEGGANALIEAVMSDVPVLASAIPGSIGLLGEDYPGLFAPGDDTALAAAIERCCNEPEFMQSLHRAAARRAPLFAPQRERNAVLSLVSSLLDRSMPGSESFGLN